MGNGGLSGVSISRHHELYKEWKLMIAGGRTPLDLEMPWITLIGRDCIRENLKDKPAATTRVFEYGSGGSSAFFMKYAAELISVEHDQLWADRVMQWATGQKTSGWNLQFLPPEPLEGKPGLQDPSDPRLYLSQGEEFAGYHFRQYASYIDRFPDLYFDVVLVDGRSRPACLVHSMPKVKRGGLLVLDNAERTYYLEKVKISTDDFSLVSSSWGALIATPQFTRTNVYLRK